MPGRIVKKISSLFGTDAATRLFLAFLVGFAVYVAWYAGVHYPVGKTRSVENDFFIWYVDNAEHVAQGGLLAIEDYKFNPPLFSFALALAKLFVADYFSAGKIISILSALVVLGCVFILVRKLFDSKVALATTAILGFNKYFLLHSYYVGTDMMFLALTCLSVTLLATQRHNYPILICAGVAGGMAYLTRYNGVFLIPAGIVALVLSSFPGVPWRLFIARGFCFGLAFFFTILPWHLFLLAREGKFFYNKNHLNMARDLLHLDENKDYYWKFIAPKYDSILDVFRHDPVKFFTSIAENFFSHLGNHYNHLIPEYLGIPTALGILALFWCVTKIEINRRERATYLISVLGYFLLMCLIKFEARYFMYMVPFYCLALVYFVQQAVSLIPWERWRAAATSAAFVGITFYAGWIGVSYQWEYARSCNTEIPKIGAFMSFMTDRSQRMLARAGNIAYFSGATFQYFPLIWEVNDVVEYAKSKDVDYIFFSATEMQVRPFYEKFIYYEKHIPGLQKILTWRQRRRYATIYKLESDDKPGALMRFNRGNFETPRLWEEFVKKTKPAQKKIVTLEGLLFVPEEGEYNLGFSAKRFKVHVDGDTVLKNPPSQTSFSIQPVKLAKGFHSINLSFEAGARSVLSPGLFWQTPDGKKSPIPRSSLIFTRVDSSTSFN